MAPAVGDAAQNGQAGLRSDAACPIGWPKSNGGNTPLAPRRPSRPEGHRLDERLRPSVWFGQGVAGLGGCGVGWLDALPWRRSHPHLQGGRG
jgi:hypothetical protein